MKIDISEQVNSDRWDLITHFILEAMNELSVEQMRSADPRNLHLEVKLNGVEIPNPEDFFKDIANRIDSFITTEAAKLINEKAELSLNRLHQVLHDTKEAIKEAVNEQFPKVVFDEEDW